MWVTYYTTTTTITQLSDEATRIAVAHRLGCRACESHDVCVCGKTVDTRGLHSLVCHRNAPRQQRHSQMNDIRGLWRAIKSAQIPAVKEPAGQVNAANAIRSNSNTLDQWEIDGLGCHCSSAESHLSFTAAEQGAAAKQAADNKTAKYQELEKTHLFSQLPSRQRDHGASTPLN